MFIQTIEVTNHRDSRFTLGISTVCFVNAPIVIFYAQTLRGGASLGNGILIITRYTPSVCPLPAVKQNGGYPPSEKDHLLSPCNRNTVLSLQMRLNALQEWSDKWLLKLNSSNWAPAGMGKRRTCPLLEKCTWTVSLQLQPKFKSLPQ